MAVLLGLYILAVTSISLGLSGPQPDANLGPTIKNGRSGEIRTPGPLVPNQMRYQAALHSDDAFLSPLRLFFKPSSLAKPVLFDFLLFSGGVVLTS